MRRSIKIGFGVAIGYGLGRMVLHVAAKEFLKSLARDDKYMAGLQERNPELYERLQKYW